MHSWTRRAAITAGAAALTAPTFAQSASDRDVPMWVGSGGNLMVRFTIDRTPSLGMVDNGLAASMLDLGYARERQLESSKDLTFAGLPTVTKDMMRFALGPANVRRRPTLIDLSAFAPERGERLRGIIGLDLLDQARTVFDFDNGVLRMSPRGRSVQMPPGTGSLPFLLSYVRMGGNAKIALPSVDCSLEGSDRIETRINLGSYAPLMVTEGKLAESWFRTGRPWSDAAAFRQGIVASAQTKNILTTLQSVQLGPFRLRNVPVEIISTEDPSAPTVATIGPQLLSRFLAAVDTADRRLLLSPGKTFDAPFHKSAIGIGFRPDGANLRVTHVASNGPAQEAGVKVDDLVTRLNGETPDRAALRTLKPGDSVELILDDGSKRVFTAREYY